MLKHYFLAVYTTAMVFCAHIYSQSSTVSGKVHSTHSGIIPHVDVVLHHMPDSIQIATTLTDEEGNYKFESLKSGTYQLSAYYVEFNEFLVKHVILATDSTSAVVDFNFEVIVSQEEEVIITSQKSVVRQDPDKMVVNVESTLSNSGLTGVDVLRKMPGISVDRDGKVTMKGRSGVMVMLDDKALYMNEEQLGNLLKSLPSDLIKEIEIITSPSAKYDAVGNAGIINIKLKQGAYEGFNGAANLSLGHGVYHKWNAGINASYKKRKFSFDGGYQYNNKQNLSDFYVYRSYNETSQGLQAFKSDSYFRLPEASHSVFLKGQYHLNRKSNFGYNLNMALGKFSWDGGSVSKWIKNDNSVKSSFESHDEGYFINKNINGGIDYKYAFDTLNTNLVLGASINHNNGRIDKHFNIQYYDSTHTNQDIPYLLTQKNITDATQLSIKADFMKTLFKKFKFESGVKANHLRDYRPLTIAITESNNYKDGSNHFLYNEGVYAAYVMGNMKFGKWSGQGGLRAEHSDISGKQTLVDTTFVRSYTNLFPSANISYKHSEKTSFSLLYSRRIRRPAGQDLNPVLNIIDPNTSWGGDPYLLPEYTDNVELAFSSLGGYLITTLNYAYTDNPILWVSKVDAQSLYTISGNRNLEHSRNMGVATTANFPITKWWNTNNYVYLYHNSITGDLGFGMTNNRSVSWMFNSTQSFKFPKGFNMEVSGNYEAPKAYALGRGSAFWQANISLQKKILKEKGSVKITLTDMFYSMQYNGKFNYGMIEQKGGYRWDNRVLMVTLNYKFGKRLDK